MILGYHRIAGSIRDEYEVCVTPQHIEQRIEMVRNNTQPIRLSKLTQNLRERSVVAKSLAITFDDGDADNLYHAKAILEKYEVPATVFVCTGNVGKEFWW